MSTVTLTIGPKTYTVSCAEGQEAHITALGAMIAEKYARLGASRAPLEAQNLLFAALFLADELVEARKQTAPDPAPAVDQVAVESLRAAIAELEGDLATARAEVTAASDTETAPNGMIGNASLAETLAQQLEAVADRAEATANALEAAAANA